MKSLHPNWFFEHITDFEYKKYVLLAYLQDVHKQFNETRLYPGLSDLVFHYRNLTSFQKQRDALFASFPEQISEIDLKNFKVSFSKVISNDDLMKHLSEVVNYSIPEIRKHLDEGKEIYDFIEKEMIMVPVGILPIYRNEGYMLLHEGDAKEIKVYEYEVKLFTHEEDQFRAVSTQYLTSYRKSFVNTAENIKIDMVRTRKKLPNPATFSVETTYEYPLEETVIPVAKRLLMQYISS